jgi:cell division protein FtsA
MDERSVYALDLGSTKAVCLAARPGPGGEVDVRGIASASDSGVYKGVVVDLHETIGAIQSVVRKTVQMTGEDDQALELVVGVGGAHLDYLTGQGLVPIFPRSRPIGRDDLLQVINHSRQIVPPPGHNFIQAVPREFRVDGKRVLQKPIGQQGERLEVDTHIITGLAEYLRQIEEAVVGAGYKVGLMVAEPLASAIAVVSPRDLDEGCAVIDIGGGTTSVAVFHGGGLYHTGSFPIGSILVSSDVQQLLKTSFEEADRLKIEFGSALAREVGEDEAVEVLQAGQTEPRPMQRKVLCEIIESRMREIANFAMRQIERSGKSGDLGAGLLLTGGGSSIRNCAALFEATTGHKARVVSPRAIGPMADLAEQPGMATAVGLAKYVLQEDEDEIAPATASSGWKDTIRTLKSLFSGKA